MQRMRRVVLGTSLLLCGCFQPVLAQSAQSLPKPTFHYATGIIVELGRAIDVLKKGIDENWTHREEYLQAFDEPDDPESPGRDFVAKSAVREALEEGLPEREIWDEQPPTTVQAARLIGKLSWERQQAIEDRSIDFGPTIFPPVTPCGEARPFCVSRTL